MFAEYLAHLGSLYAHRYPSLAELAKFCLVGVLGLIVDMSTVVALKELWGLDTRLCAVLGFSVAVTTNFALNRRYTFAQGRELPLLFSYVTYVGTNLAGLALRMLAIEVFIALAGVDQGRGYLLSNLVGIALATLLNFIGAKYFAFDPARLEAQPEAGATSHGSSASAVRIFSLPAVLLLCACASYAVFRGVLQAELTSGADAVNVTMADNIRKGLSLLVHPSVFPGGHSDWLREDLPALGNLPFYPLLLSLVPAAWGLPGAALISLLALVITVFFTARLCALVDARAGLFCALLMASSPALLRSFRAIGFEPLLTACCAAGLYLFVAGAWHKRRAQCFAGGLMLGLGFLTKMWLIVPYAFAVLFFCGIEARAARRSGTSLGLRRNFAVLCLGFALTAGAHLVFVACTSPVDIPHWISSVYLGLFSGEGVTAAKLAGRAAEGLRPRSVFYYPLVLYRDHFFVLPLVLLGLGEVLRDRHARTAQLLATVCGACLALVALSVPAVKQPAYVLAVEPFLYALAGLSLAALVGSAPKNRPANVALVHVATGLAAVSVACVLLAQWSPWSAAVPAWYVLAHGLGMLLVCLVGQAWARSRSLPHALVAACAIGLGSFALAESWVAPAAPAAEQGATVQQRTLPAANMNHK